ncbi:MAG: NAD-dependent epimerase/dehydratase family protein [Myxococcota bacterium]
MNATLVTAATTPVGRAIIEALVADPSWGPVLAVAAEPESQARLPADPRITYARVDLTRDRDVRRLLFGLARELRIREIVHTPLHRRASERGRRVYALNVESTRGLLLLAEAQSNIERFVLRSTADVYRIEADQPVIVDEDHPLHLHTRMPQYLCDRVEADITVCTRTASPGLATAVLRCAEILAPDCGSQLHDYLQSRVCFRPLGFDPMMHVMSVADAVRAVRLALVSQARGVFNVPGKDILPLSEIVARVGRRGIAVPAPVLAPLYGLRGGILGTDFRYGLNHMRFHFSGVLDGRRAGKELGYEPRVSVDFAGLLS